MMMSFKLFTAIVLGVTVSPFGGQVFATEVSKHLSSYIEPEPIKRNQVA
jgi:hypothetical protein